MVNYNIGDSVTVEVEKDNNIIYQGIVDDVFEISLTENVYKVKTDVGYFYLNHSGKIINI